MFFKKRKTNNTKIYLYEEYSKNEKLKEKLNQFEKELEEYKKFEDLLSVAKSNNFWLNGQIARKDEDIKKLNNEIQSLKDECGKYISKIKDNDKDFIVIAKKWKEKENEIQKSIANATPEIEREFAGLLITKIDEMPAKAGKNQIKEMIENIFEV